jgi:hypothetical protein
MRKDILSTMALLIAAPASAQTADAKDWPITARSDQEEKISMGFSGMDSNSDGHVDWDEWEAIMYDKGVPRSAEAETESHKAFDTIDTDRNGLITKQELSAWALKTFDCLDQNHDGTVMKSEEDQGDRCFEPNTEAMSQGSKT